MADEQDQAEALDDPESDEGVTDSVEDRVRREDPDGERVGNLTLTDLDEGAGPDEEKDLVGSAVGDEDDPLAGDRVPPAPEESAVPTESQ